MTRITLVAGGSGGIGSAICREFAAQGDRVVFTYHSNAAKAAALVAELGGGARAIGVDLADADAVRAAIDAIEHDEGPIANAVYAAGPAFEMRYAAQISPAEWARVMAVDGNGCFNLFHAALAHMKPRKAGNLLALSTCALKQPPKADLLSAAPKAAIDMLVKVIAKEEGRNGIRANTVELGFINAGLAAHHIAHTWGPELVEQIVKNTPLRRLGEAQEVAKAVAFLCSDNAAFITGQALAVDGGAQL
ncbi:SDR family NAD(P)-dependent oxidoreductase [Novosphingobium lentum]|uniref:SDR family NAD(P)-dependent oxidoreductase n=1 Tax=Novosphingobium lentum TaxID=145287 RepID=UPI0008305B44|nr:SDR family oxidoreductase [Novosphingobium lentum]